MNDKELLDKIVDIFELLCEHDTMELGKKLFFKYVPEEYFKEI